MTQTQKKPEGLLRISAPVILGQETFYAFLSSFLKTYPRIQADMFITNVFLDLIVENIDIAIRFGELQDSSLIAQRIGKSPPSRPEDLREHQCVLLHARNNTVLPKARSIAAFPVRTHSRNSDHSSQRIEPAVNRTAARCEPQSRGSHSPNGATILSIWLGASTSSMGCARRGSRRDERS